MEKIKIQLDPNLTVPQSQYGYGKRFDRAMNLCIAEYGTCPFGCEKGGAPNCAHNVSLLRCEPAQRTAEQSQ